MKENNCCAFSRGVALATLFGIALSSAPFDVFADSTINLDAGYLYGTAGLSALPAGTTAVPTTGSLLLLVASATGTTFGGPVAGSYTSDGDVILGEAGFNTNFGTGGTMGNGGETTNAFTLSDGAAGTSYPTTLVGHDIALYWFPGITLGNYESGTEPSMLTAYGAYSPQAIALQPNPSLNPDMGDDWVVPADSTTSYNLNFFTTADGGTQVEAEGYADGMVAAVPEPSSFAWLGLAAAAMLGVRAWALRRRV